MMSIVVDFLVVAALVIAPFWFFWRDRKVVGTEITVVAGWVVSGCLVLMFNLLGVLVGIAAPTIENFAGNVVSIKGDPHGSAVFIRVGFDGQLRSYETDNLKFQETEDAGVVAEITATYARRESVTGSVYEGRALS